MPELLAALSLMGILAGLCYPAWQTLLSARARACATAIVMDALDQGRREAIGGDRNVWVVMRRGSPAEHDSMRLVADGRQGAFPLGGWIRLPGGTRFGNGDGDLCGATPPEGISFAAGVTNHIGGAVMFRRSGTVGWPKEGEASLSVRLENAGGDSHITIARGTGRVVSDAQ